MTALLIGQRSSVRAVAAALLLFVQSCAAAGPARVNSPSVERWDIFEIALDGLSEGNPFVDVELRTEFTKGDKTVRVTGFYDGDGVYRVRFMPEEVGQWTYRTSSNVEELSGVEGTFECAESTGDNHGPVRVKDTYHFAYADGTPYYQFGTTCYAWIHQSDELQEQTLKTLATAPFNKLRMCVFPKNYTYCKTEPQLYPFEKDGDSKFDFTRFSPAFFHHLEQRVRELGELGIEADLILFHPYDEGRWGFDRMDAESDRRYLRYVVARLSAFRNVWWSMANEFDFMRNKKPSDWDDFFQIVRQTDPYGHFRGIHNGAKWYDHTKEWVTHASIQSGNLGEAKKWRNRYKKPIVDDECQYEGNIREPWGNITAQELVHRFWLGTAVGCYVGHGETYVHPEDILWWSKGGVLHGESPARIAFLRKLVEEGPPVGLEPIEGSWEWNVYAAGRKGDDYYLAYFGVHQPVAASLPLPEVFEYKAEVIDTWNMTITPVSGTFRGKKPVPLPGRPYMAVRLQKVTD
jgi:hypothetical protein